MALWIRCIIRFVHNENGAHRGATVDAVAAAFGNDSDVIYGHLGGENGDMTGG